jgi:hypothetical protein
MPPSALSPTLLPQLCHNQTGITVVEVEDLRQTITMETGYRETSAWLQSVHTLNNMIAMHVCQEDQNPKLSPSPWDGPLTLLVWYAWLPSSRTLCRTLSLLFPCDK